MSEMVDRHAAVLKDYVRDGDVETARSVSVAALLAALDPEDEALVSAIAQRLADDATVARNESRLIRQGIDLSSAEPVSPSIFKKDARVMIATLKAILEQLCARLEDEREELKDRSRITGEFSALDPMTAQRIANTMYDAQEALASLSRRLEAYKALCLEAAELYGSGGTFPINGEMSQRLELAGQGVVLSTAPSAEDSDAC